MRRRSWLCLLTAVVTLLVTADLAMAATGEKRSYLQWFIWPGGGVIGVLLMLIDVASIALIIEHFISIRRTTILPEPVVEHIRAMLEEKQYREVIEYCGAEPSAISYVVHAALGEASHGYAAMERAMEEAAEDRTTKLLRKIEALNVVGNIAPMLGLLGTVLGMILAFGNIVEAGGIPDVAELANSIGIALVTTFWGLIVAVPALAVYAVMRNRIDGLAAETAMASQELISIFRPGAKKEKD